jgi:hypothetical protein
MPSYGIHAAHVMLKSFNCPYSVTVVEIQFADEWYNESKSLVACAYECLKQSLYFSLLTA